MLLKQTHEGEITPVGFSIRKKSREYTASIQLRIPIFVWWRKGYDISWDEVWIGWWALHLFISLDKGYGPLYGLRCGIGWVFLGKPMESHA